ncbi:MAG: hypothetical protein K2X29_01910 [Candidatus Obscuribacterales bacterium]|nr:hypothetical protein [Candidatus Obscuribacterales bacterium]
MNITRITSQTAATHDIFKNYKGQSRPRSGFAMNDRQIQEKILITLKVTVVK